jgi:hypothetical protein
VVKNASKITIVAAATIAIAASASAAVSDGSKPVSQSAAMSKGTGLLPKDIIVDSLGMIERSIKPSTKPVRVACDANCSSNRC